MSFKTILFMMGLLLIILSAAMLIPAMLPLFMTSYESLSFLLSASISGFVGILLTLANMQPKEKMFLGMREAFILTTMSWCVLATFSSLPFVLSESPLSWTDALFEGTSALTATGATILKRLDRVDPAILLWRALLQGLGGVGIIVMALTVLPILRIGGMQLFRTESSERWEKILPRTSQIARSIFMTLFYLTLIFTGLLCLAGMDIFQALCHALSALSTGGLSTSDSSIAVFESFWVELILTIAMLIGASTLALLIRAWDGDWKPLWRDPQLRGFLKIIGVAICVLTCWRYWSTPAASYITTLRETVFSVVSAITSTGFRSTTVSLWTHFEGMFILLLAVMGGCTGSTAGGIKIFRVQVLFSVVKSQISQLRHPHGVFISHYGHHSLSESIISSVFTFLALFGGTFFLIAMLVCACGVDVLTSLSVTMSALCNTGMMDALSGPGQTTAVLPDGSKWILMGAMILGRLELITVFLLFSPSFWKE